MDANGVFRCEGDLEINGRYSFKSLLLDGVGVNEVGMSGAHQLVLTGDLEVAVDPLYRDDVMGGRESFKSLLLDGESMEEDEIEFSPGNQQVGNGNHAQISALPTVVPAVGSATEEVESFSMVNQGLDCVNQHTVGYVEQEVVDFVDVTQAARTKAPVRKRRRGNGSSLPVEGERDVPEMGLDRFMDAGFNAGLVPQIGLQQQPLSSTLLSSTPLSSTTLSSTPLSSLPQAQPMQSMPPSKKMKQAEMLNSQPLARKKKQGGTSSDVQRLLDSVISRQEMFFKDLLESMERKEAIRERIREEKEEKWRAEERAQLGVFNNAMLALTQELLGNSKCGTQSTDKAK